MSEQAIIRLMLASSCFGREVCPAPPCACARSLNDLLGAEQDAEIGRLNELLLGLGANRYWEGRWRDDRVEMGRKDTEITRLHHEKAALVEAMQSFGAMADIYDAAIKKFPPSVPAENPCVSVSVDACRKARAALRSATETPSTSAQEGEPT